MADTSIYRRWGTLEDLTAHAALTCSPRTHRSRTPAVWTTTYRLLAERGQQLQTMLDCARAGGEHPPDALDVLDHILAPLGTGPLKPD